MTAGGLLVCGTGSDSGKSTVVLGLCRLLARRGLRVAPFKAQNMALNSAVTLSGHEIGRAQATQAEAAGVEPEVAMNPVLLKPSDDHRSQVVVEGRPWATLGARDYQVAKDSLWPLVTGHLEDLRSRFDVVVCEGAGSPAEINLLRHDITNLRLAREAGLPAVLVGDIDRGGVFASLYGTVSILPNELSGVIRAFLINKFRGDPSLLVEGIDELASRTGLPTLGVLPWMDGIGIDAEDSLGLGRPWGQRRASGSLDVAVVRLPRISNFTDIDALALEPAVSVRAVSGPSSLGHPDLLILPGSKATVADLAWLRRSGLAAAVCELSGTATTVLGVCGGYQMLGATIEDDAVESAGRAEVDGLGLLPVVTRFESDKLTRRVTASLWGQEIRGYEIRHGRTEPEGLWTSARDGAVVGTSLHGLFENDGFRRAFLAEVAGRAGLDWDPGPAVYFADQRRNRAEFVADVIEAHVDMAAVDALIEEGAAP